MNSSVRIWRAEAAAELDPPGRGPRPGCQRCRLDPRGNMLAVPIRDTSRPGSRVVTELIPDVGQAVLDRITALPRTWLIGDEPVAELHPDRHARSAGGSAT
jgi:hypothetical protein